jgi:hypothetical protein
MPLGWLKVRAILQARRSQPGHPFRGSAQYNRQRSRPNLKENGEDQKGLLEFPAL